MNTITGDPRRARRVRRGMQAGMAVLLAVATAAPAAAMRDDTVLISRTTSGGPAADSSATPTPSADGRIVVFESVADNLSTDDDNAVVNIFAATSSPASRNW